MNDNIQDITNSVLKYDDLYMNINVNWLSCKKERTLNIYGETGLILFDDMAEKNKLMFYPNVNHATITAGTLKTCD